MFDPLDVQPYAKVIPLSFSINFHYWLIIHKQYNASNVNTPAHQQLAELAALRGIVLLKNNKGVLPLAKSGTVAVIGPNAQATTVLQGILY